MLARRALPALVLAALVAALLGGCGLRPIYAAPYRAAVQPELAAI